MSSTDANDAVSGQPQTELDAVALRREQLVEFYQQRDPSKVDVVDALLDNPYEDLFNALMDKYGEVPAAWLASTAEMAAADTNPSVTPVAASTATDFNARWGNGNVAPAARKQAPQAAQQETQRGSLRRATEAPQ